MDIRQMRYFEAVVRYKSFSQAALNLYIAQPALGVQIRKLEEELGVQLLVRSPRGAEPTDSGMLLLERIQKILADVEATKRAVADSFGPVRGRISIGMTPSAGSVLAVPLLQRCQHELPEVSLNLVEAMGGVLIEWLQMDRLDMAVAFSVPPILGLQSRILMEEIAYLVQPVNNNHHAVSGEPVSFTEAVCERLILPSPPSRLRQIVDEQAKALNIDLKIPFEVQSIPMMLKLVEQGFGATIMSSFGLTNELREKRLIARPIQDPSIIYPIALVRSDSTPLPKAQAAVQQIILELVDSEMRTRTLET